MAHGAVSRDVLAISQHPNFQQGQLCQIAMIDRERDALASTVKLARSLISDAELSVRRSGRLGKHLSVAGTAGLVLLDQGDREGVRAAIDVCIGPRLASGTSNFTYAFGLAALAELVAYEGTEAEVAALLPLVAACTGRHASMLGIVTLGSMHRVHGMLLSRGGDHVGARFAFERAVADHDRGGSVVLRARIRVEASHWLSDGPAEGHPAMDPARLLAEADVFIERHQLTRLSRDAERVRSSARLHTPSG